MRGSFTDQIKQRKTDEWYTPAKAVRIIVPYLLRKGYKKIICPFDKEESNFVQVLRENGFEVAHSHIEDGIDFFGIENFTEYDAVVSNPPYSRREEILEKLYMKKIPFALILNSNGLFDSRKRWELFRDNEIQILVPSGRIHFFNDKTSENCPNFQSIYVCSGILDKQIEFAEMEKNTANDTQVPGQIQMVLE